MLYPAEDGKKSERAESEGGKADFRALLGRGKGAAADLGPLAATRHAQPAVFAVEYALAQLWRQWGVEPMALLGYSLGEYTAACLAGVLTLEDALALVARRAELIDALPAGGMLAVPLPADELTAILEAFPALSLAATHGPLVSVAAGPEEALAGLEERLAAEDLVGRRLATTHAFHSAMMEPAVAAFREALGSVTLSPPRVPLLSNVTGGWMTAAEATDPEYWVRHLLSTVRFAEGLATLAEEAPILLEVGPGQALATTARQQQRELPAVPTLRDAREGGNDTAFLLGALGQVWLAGGKIDPWGLVRHETRRRVPLPTYAFDRQRYWADLPAQSAAPARRPGGKRPDPTDWFYVPVWRPTPLPPTAPAPGTGERWLVITAGARGEAVIDALGDALGDALEASGSTVVRAPLEAVAGVSGYRDLLRGSAGEGGPWRVAHLACLDLFDGDGSSGDRADADAATAGERGAASLLAVTQALSAEAATEGVTLVAVTAGLFQLPGDSGATAPGRPEQAPLLGLLRVLPQEHREMRCVHLDTAGAGAAELTPEALAAELWAAVAVAGGGETTLARRGGQRWVQRFEPLPLPPADPATHPERSGLRRDGLYLITGGLGRVGLLLAEQLTAATGGAIKLLLVGRTPFERLAADDPRRGRVAALEAAGATVRVAACDVADEGALTALLVAAEQDLGPLRGVAHLAGAITATQAEGGLMRSVEDTDEAWLGAQLHAKVRGTRALDGALRAVLQQRAEPPGNTTVEGGLDFAFLYSSLASTLGGLGFTAYAAGNAFLDAFAASAGAVGGDGGVPWQSLGWDGFRTEPVPPGQTTQGTGLILEMEESAEVFQRLLHARGVPQILISTGDLHARLAAWVTAVSQDSATDGESGAESPEEGASPLGRSPRPALSTPYTPPEGEVQGEIAAIWQELLGVDRVGIHDRFFELGGDSLLATQLISRLRRAFQVQLSIARIFDAPTVAGLAAVVAGEAKDEQLDQLEALFAKLEGMSADEVEEEIARKGGEDDR
jgi:acyl transferase domain-containing protein